MAAKETSKTQKAKPRSRVKASAVTQRPTYAQLSQQLAESLKRENAAAIKNVRLFQDLKEALEQQTATSEILGVIASSPTDLEPVLNAVAENAAKVCGANDAIIFRLEHNVLRPAASYGTMPLSTTVRVRGVPVSRGTVVGRAIVDRHSIHVDDLAAELEEEFPEAKPYQQQVGWRTCLATPSWGEKYTSTRAAPRRTCG